MTKMNPYEKSPSFESEHFALRLVRPSDAESLLLCYSDPQTAPLINADNCTSDFRFKTFDEMTDCIAFWRTCYRQKNFIRLTILLKSSQEPLGTVEVFGGGFQEEQVAVDGTTGCIHGFLRLDIRSDYENGEALAELFGLAVSRFYEAFAFDVMLTKAVPEATARLSALQILGFQRTGSFRPGQHYFSRTMKIPTNPGIAYCGLACCVCGENSRCPGCRSERCGDRSWCVNINCCREKGLDGCWECRDFPCKGSMLDKVRVRAFARFARQYGTDRLVECLMKNNAQGVVYHHAGQLVGDYDQFQTEDEITHFILAGKCK